MTSATGMLTAAPTVDAMAADVCAGLARRPKQLPSRYLYDARGARLFERICELGEYYLTRTELSILTDAMPELARRLGPRILLLEPGSGASSKTRLLLRHLISPAAYIPIDVSCDQLHAQAFALSDEFPDLEIRPTCADFLSDFELPPVTSRVKRRVAFFPGSTIGNLTDSEAVTLLRRLRAHCGRQGAILLGADLQKDPAVLERAYNDAKGISGAFALNYLNRLNHELGANFRLTQFSYSAQYDPGRHWIRMGLVSRCPQAIEVAGRTFAFARNELVQTEISCKYSPASMAALASAAGLSIDRFWTDQRHYFGVFLLSVK